MSDYRFVTIWEVDAPLQEVWDLIVDADQWPSWWKAVEQVVELKPGQPDHLGNLRRYTWKTPLSYTLTIDMRVTRFEPPVLLEGIASGDVEGRGLWQFSSTGPRTVVHYTWNVRTTKPWMNLLALLIRPVMEWNHNAVMRQGGEGLAQRLGTRLIRMETADGSQGTDHVLF